MVACLCSGHEEGERQEMVTMIPEDYCVCVKCLKVVKHVDAFGRCDGCHKDDPDLDWINGVLSG